MSKTIENALRVEQLTEPYVDSGFAGRAEWGPGPWQDEPDLVEWRHVSGLPCLVVRGPTGAWCGYVGVPGSHPWFGHEYGKVDEHSSHGGLTFSGTCRGDICHVAQDGEPETVWWFGFDCAHAGDLAPGLNVYRRKAREQFSPEGAALLGLSERVAQLAAETYAEDSWEKYRDLPYVRGCVDELAHELMMKGTQHVAFAGWWLKRHGYIRTPMHVINDLLAGVKLFFRRDLPQFWREIYLEQDRWGRGPEERAQLELSYGEDRWDPNGLANVAKARRRDRPWPKRDRW